MGLLLEGMRAKRAQAFLPISQAGFAVALANTYCQQRDTSSMDLKALSLILFNSKEKLRT